MHIVDALKGSSFAKHRGGNATVLAFEDMGFRLLTINDATYVIQDLAPGTAAINGVPYDQVQLQTFTEHLTRTTGIRFDDGLTPRIRRWRRLVTRIQTCLIGLAMTVAYIGLRLFRSSRNA